MSNQSCALKTAANTRTGVTGLQLSAPEANFTAATCIFLVSTQCRLHKC